MFKIDLTRPIEVKTGDYRRQWMKATILNISSESHKDEEGNVWSSMNMEVGFEDGLTQCVADVEDLFNFEWRYMKEDLPNE